MILNPLDLADFPNNAPTPDGEYLYGKKTETIIQSVPDILDLKMSDEIREKIITDIEKMKKMLNVDSLGDLTKGEYATAGYLQYGVNKSDSVLNVRTGPSTSNRKIGQLNVKESFCFTGNKHVDSSGYEWYKIDFLSPSGWATGWYRGYNGVGYWKNNPKFFYDGAPVMRVVKTTNLYAYDGTTLLGTYPAPTSSSASNFLCYPSEGCHTGRAKKNLLWVNVCIGSSLSGSEIYIYEPVSKMSKNGGKNYAFANTNIMNSSVNTNIKGNW
ncbi:SH3 domain-containing protein [Faecalimicrobium sp. JNUCC 81]